MNSREPKLRKHWLVRSILVFYLFVPGAFPITAILLGTVLFNFIPDNNFLFTYVESGSYLFKHNLSAFIPVILIILTVTLYYNFNSDASHIEGRIKSLQKT